MAQGGADRLRYQRSSCYPTAVEAGGKHIKDAYEAWITPDPIRSGARVLITGPLGFERTAQFKMDEDSFEITERVRAKLEE